MIQPTAPTAPAPAVTAGAVLAAQPGDSAETADFGALLTMQLQAPAPTDGAAAALPGAIPAAIAAIAAPATGKILPPVLPDALPDAQALPEPATLAIPTLPAALLKARPAAPAAQADPEQPATPPEAEAEADAEPEAASDAAPRAPELAAMIAAAVPAAPQPVEQAPTTAPMAPASASAAMPHPAAPAAAPSSASQPAPQPAPQLASLPEAAKAERDAAVQQVRLIDPAQTQPVAATETVLSAPQGTRDPAPAALTATPAAERPHDFTALVDRLVAAREAMQPQSVTMAVRHAEFGAVQLRFQQDTSGLSVAMSSADPDFARAVSAAALPVQAASATDTASFSQHGRGEAGSGGNADGSAQPRSGQQGQREDRAPVRANPSPATSRTASGSESDSGRSGIFA